MEPSLRRIQSILLTLFLPLSLFLFTTFLVLAQDDPRASSNYQNGQKLWTANCVSCHKVDKKLVGPALAGVNDKYDKEWLYSWIKNSQAMVKAGDPDAVAIFEEYNKSVMTAFPMLKDADIDDILTFIQVETDHPQAAAGDAASTGSAASSNWGPMGIFLAIITALLLVIALVLARLLRTLDVLVREKNNEPIPVPVTVKRILDSRVFRIAATLLLFAFLSTTVYDNASSLGRQQGYAPEQPIKFSHELHAGKHGIDCQYCHSGASKGKSAVIPSSNVCMNCHKAIQEGPQYGTKEIDKIYASIGWDKEKLAYIEGYEQKPIEWTRIHNLPDHVYFSHAQHVNAGKVECQTCHGAVEEMEVMKQENSLGMNWCVDCHRDTEVQFVKNDYYKAFEQLHNDLKEGKIDKVTVEDIGGLECQKCHY